MNVNYVTSQNVQECQKPLRWTIGKNPDLPLETPAKSGVNTQALNESDSRWFKFLTSTTLVVLFWLLLQLFA